MHQQIRSGRRGRAGRWAALGAVSALAAALLTAPSTAAAAASAAVPAAPGSPGASATWTTGDKEGIGTSTTTASKIWYTLTGGTMSEVYYPNGQTPNTRELDFAVTDGSSWTQLETDASVDRTVSLADPKSLTYQQISTDHAGRWRLIKTYVTDPDRASVLMDVSFQALKSGAYQLFTLYDPSLAGDSGNDSGSTSGSALVATDTHVAGTPVASALLSSVPFSKTSTGFVGSSDGATDISVHHTLSATYPAAGPGNIAQAGQVPVDGTAGHTTHFTLALSFAADANHALAGAKASLQRPFRSQQANYQRGWHHYVNGLRRTPRGVTGALADQYWASVMAVKANQDKTYPGAFIASLTIPWGQAVDATGAGGAGNGYHFVWARDEYEQATGLLAAGDVKAAQDAVNWLFTRQQQPDGHFPQNSKVDGTPDQTNIQLDETAYPLILAWQVGQFDKTFYTQHIAKAADYLVATGPATPQERWEETGGYSPSTIADEIAGLTAAAAIATKVGDRAGAAIYQATADQWQRSIEKWTYTSNGNLSDGQYYIRISGSGNPDDGATRNWANGAGTHPENAVVDAGFLELTRLGVKAPTDSYVAHSLAAVDQSLMETTPAGAVWKRYTYDGYGETADGAPWTGVGIGRPWPLLSGERGEYVLGTGGNALSYLQTMANTANAGRMIPEQIWDQTDPTSYHHVDGKGTGSAAPLSWAMAQYVRLAQGIGQHKVVETPAVVAQRYATGHTPSAPTLTVAGLADQSVADSRTVTVKGTTTAVAVYLSVNGVKQQLALTGGVFNTQITLSATSNQLVIAAVGANGGTAQIVRTIQTFGTAVGSLTDPTGDDNGPGSYVYPTDGAFNAGSFDLTNFTVYQDGADIRMVTRTAGQINNPWGGNGMSTQRLNIYVHGAADTSTTATPLLPGSNMSGATGWSQAIVADGRHDTSTYGEGVYGTGLNKIGAADLQVLPSSHLIVVTVPAAVFGTTDLATATYQVSMFSDAEDSEGIGNIRPVYSHDCWAGTGCPGFVGQYRFGGGAGTWDPSLPSVDTDTADPNAIDIISGATVQSTALDWTKGSPVVVPYLGLTR
ncbi:glucan 1,4-alpha-glucosidase [Nakamurella panacisegetis]|uniref:Glucan 1,4-alpha-glucosidase n=1 Tax=Nakamurella panacisegetis TaxID=1090615 RepID=A0A1H0LIN0_9ACTN|nr:glucan 1,4-alpha-glucosidase [Nakamurella panacisegetis]SDO68012.1 glucan 1,4-alpha-glucosidase [Nakamurella panacisegetis]